MRNEGGDGNREFGVEKRGTIEGRRREGWEKRVKNWDKKRERERGEERVRERGRESGRGRWYSERC